MFRWPIYGNNASMVLPRHSVVAATTYLAASHGLKHPVFFAIGIAEAVVVCVLIYLIRNNGKWWK